MIRNNIYDDVCNRIDSYYNFAYANHLISVRDVSYWLIGLQRLHGLAIDYASFSSLAKRLEDTLMKSLVYCVLCMQQNGTVRRGLGPVAERILCRAETPLYKVFAEINAERDYQDNLPPNRTDGWEKDAHDYLVMYDTYLRDAFDAWTNNAGSYHALDVVRKLAGILVHCFEDMT